MLSHGKLVCLGSALPAIAVLAHGCKGPTQVTVIVSTNVVCAEQRGVDVVAASDPRRAEERAALVTTGPRFPSGTTAACEEGPPPRHVGTLVVTPVSENGAVVVIAAFGSARLADCVAPQLAPQCIVSRRRFSFVEGRSLTLPIVLDPDCAGVPCNETSTCVGKKCVDSLVECVGDTCSEPGIGADGGLVVVDGAGPLEDAGPSDAAQEGDAAPMDSGPDGTFGTDGGAGVCNPTGACVPPMGTVLPPNACAGGGACCYEQGNFSCKSFATCPALAACCRGSLDCGGGSSVCCADTDPATAETRITCKDVTECVMTGVMVCSEADPGCGPANCVKQLIYSADPEYFRCS